MVVILAMVPLFCGGLLLVNWLLAPSSANVEKLSGYECGFVPLVGQTRNSFTLLFYLVRLLFMVFDLELILLYPGVAMGASISFMILTGIVMFLLMLALGLVYEIRSRALDWN